MSVLGIDTSNYTDPLTPAKLAAWKANGVELVICQAVEPPAVFPPGKTRVQIQQCLDAGLTVDAYVWLWFDLNVTDIERKLFLLEGLPIRRLWLDVEDEAAAKYTQATVEAKIRDALVACDTWARGHALPVQPTGIYSGYWWWTDRRLGGNTIAFRGRALWDSQYDNVADAASGFVPYGGWTTRAIKQYRGTSTFGGVGGVDLNVLSDAEAALLHPPTGGTDTRMAIHVGQGMHDQMAANGDAPLCDHTNEDQVDDDGKPYKVERCRGAKGLYISSNASGDWVNAGPV